MRGRRVPSQRFEINPTPASQYVKTVSEKAHSDGQPRQSDTETISSASRQPLSTPCCLDGLPGRVLKWPLSALATRVQHLCHALVDV